MDTSPTESPKRRADGSPKGERDAEHRKREKPTQDERPVDDATPVTRFG